MKLIYLFKIIFTQHARKLNYIEAENYIKYLYIGRFSAYNNYFLFLYFYLYSNVKLKIYLIRNYFSLHKSIVSMYRNITIRIT